MSARRSGATVNSVAPHGTASVRARPGRPVLITGGAGFVGCNLADSLLEAGERVRLFDDLSRPGVEGNLQWLRSRHGGDCLQFIRGDVRDPRAVQEAVDGSAFVFHLAAQTAVTISLKSPLDDHGVNVGGTLNVLEAARNSRPRPGLMFASTNKVYGCLADLQMRRTAGRCVPCNPIVRHCGIGEERPLQFASPYGCSKGAADQYVLDYARTFELSAVVLRMSCIYGPHQQANSDQGWVAHFLRVALNNEVLTIYGDGKQVRDVLFIEDLVAALHAAREQIEDLKGGAFNIGGGTRNTLSLLELIELTERLNDRRMEIRYEKPRLGDQLYFVANHTKFSDATGWRPETPVDDGVAETWRWLMANRIPYASVAEKHREKRA